MNIDMVIYLQWYPNIDCTIEYHWYSEETMNIRKILETSIETWECFLHTINIETIINFIKYSKISSYDKFPMLFYIELEAD